MTTATIDLRKRSRARPSAEVRLASSVRSALLTRPETLALAVVAAVGYIVAAWVFRYHFGYAVGDALARSAKAVYMGASRDPHFGAVGFYWPPLPSTIQIPLVLALKSSGRMDFAGPLSTALLTAGSILVLGRICGELGLGRPTSLVLCILFGANPVIFVYAINGMSEACAYLCILVVLLAWLRWVRRREVEDLAVMGVALAALVMTRIETIPLAIGLGIVVGAGRDVRQWIARAVTVALPALVATALWMATQFILLGDALAFLHYGTGQGGEPHGYTAVFRHEYDLPAHGGYLATVPWALAWVVVFAPGVLALLALGMARPRRHLYVACGLACVASVFPLVQMYLIEHQTGFGDPRYFSGMIPVGAVAVAYLAAVMRGTAPQPMPVFRSEADDDGSPPASAGVPTRPPRLVLRRIGGLMIGCTLAVTGVVGLVYMLPANRTRIGDEHFVFQILLGERVQRQHLLAPSAALSAYLDPYQAKGQLAILDTDYAFAVVLLSKHPSGFIIPEDRDFLTTLEDPAGKFQWIVAPATPAATNGVSDQITPLITPPNYWAKAGVYGDLVLWHFVGPASAQSSSVPSAGT